MQPGNGQNMPDPVFLVHFFHFFIQTALFSQKDRAHSISIIFSQMPDQFFLPGGSHALEEIFNPIRSAGNQLHLFCPDQETDSLLFIIKFLVKVSGITG